MSTKKCTTLTTTDQCGLSDRCPQLGTTTRWPDGGDSKPTSSSPSSTWHLCARTWEQTDETSRWGWSDRVRGRRTNHVCHGTAYPPPTKTTLLWRTFGQAPIIPIAHRHLARWHCPSLGIWNRQRSPLHSASCCSHATLQYDCVQVHIIIEQAKWQQHVVCLVSIWQEQFSLHSLDSWAHRAYSVEQLQNAASMLRVTELTTACRLGTCRITMRGFPFTLFDLEHLDAAENIVIRLQEPSRVEDEMDDMDLMQRQQGSANQQALDMTVKTEEYSGFRHLNPDPSSRPAHQTFGRNLKMYMISMQYGEQELLHGKMKYQRLIFRSGSCARAEASKGAYIHAELHSTMMSQNGETDFFDCSKIRCFQGFHLKSTLSGLSRRTWNLTSRPTLSSRSSSKTMGLASSSQSRTMWWTMAFL